MRIYLDMCSLQRPLDTKTQIRVAVEAEAILNILALWESGQIELVSSPALRHWYRLSKSAKTDSIGLRGNEKIIQD